MRSIDTLSPGPRVRLDVSVGNYQTHDIHSMGSTQTHFLRCDRSREMSIFSIRGNSPPLILRIMDGDIIRHDDHIQRDPKCYILSIHGDRSILHIRIRDTLESMGRIHSMTRIRNGHDMGRNKDNNCQRNKLGNRQNQFRNLSHQFRNGESVRTTNPDDLTCRIPKRRNCPRIPGWRDGVRRNSCPRSSRSRPGDARSWRTHFE